jgi:alkylation response protein AidB-like acyl-CoA dehydrogenase
MDFEATPDQEALRAGARAFLSQACPPTLVRRAFEGRFDPKAGELWAKMVELDWPALCIPQNHGGLGYGFVELAVVVEELGRVVAPSPFLATLAQFAPMVAEAGSSEQREVWLRPVAQGRITGTVALAEAAGRWDPAAVATTAEPAGSGWVLSGRKSYVLDGCSADEVVVVARRKGSSGSDGLGIFVVAGSAVTARALDVRDPTQPLAELTFAGTEVDADRVLAEPGDDRAALAVRRAVEQATVAMATSVTGTCRAIFDATLQYAKDRYQYGRPIGSFQALKHRLVDMYLALERSSALCYFAAMTIAEDDERRAVAASAAKAAAGECQRLIVQDGLQMHGGIGFTWEHDLHLFLKRAKSGDFLFGPAGVHRAAVARMLGVAA